MLSRAGKGTLCVTDGEEGQLRAGAGLGGPGRQARREAHKGLVLARAPAPTSCLAKSPRAHHPHQSVRESSSSTCPASRDEHRGLHKPPSVTAASTDVPQCSWPFLCAGSGEAERSMKALGLCTAECGLLLPGHLTGSRVGSIPRGTSRIQPCPSSQPAQPPLLVQLLEKGLAKFVGADHDGAGGCHFNDAGQEACKQPSGARLGTDAPHE